MKNLALFILLVPALLNSCTKNNAKISMTFNKGIAVYGDIDEIRSTPLVAAPTNIEEPGKIFIGDNFLLIGEKGSGIHVFDNTNPANPINVSFIQLPFTKEFYVVDNIIYAESQYDFLKIDLSNITNPVLIDRVEYAFGEAIENGSGEILIGFSYVEVTETFKLDSKEAQELEESYYLYYDYNNNLIPASTVPTSFVGAGREIKGTLNKISVHNGHAYVVSDRKIHYFQDSPGAMSLLGSKEIGVGIETIYAENDNLFIGTESSMIVMDITNPSSPNYTSEYNHPNSCDPVLPNGDIAYLTLRTSDFSGCSGAENTLDVLDISDINNPEVLNSVTMTSPYGMAVIGDKLFVGEGENGLTIFDITNPSKPVFIETKTGIVAYDVIEHPTVPGQFITTSDFSLRQLRIDYNTLNVTFLSELSY